MAQAGEVTVEPKQDDSASAQATALALPKETDRHVKTAGEKKFNKITYNWIGFIVNSIISVISVYWVERTHSGQALMNGAAKRISQTGISESWARFIGNKTFFLSGGFAVLLPMKWMEDAKVKLVEKWDREIYGDKVDTDPSLKQSHKELEESPKQTWRSILSGRALALVPFYLTIGLLWSRTSLISQWTNPELAQIGKKGLEEALKLKPDLGFFKRIQARNEAFTLAEHLDPKGFAQTANKGWYFDRAVTWVGRTVGKATASITGKKDIVAEIKNLEQEFPGKVNSEGLKAVKNRDPDHSTIPYYIGSELITCGMVAAGVYLITRLTGPFFGASKEQRKELKEQHREERKKLHELPIASTDSTPPPSTKKLETPTTQVALAGIEHQHDPAQTAARSA